VSPRRRLALGLALLFAALPAAAAESAKPAPGPSRLLVRGEEFNLTLSQLKLDPGDAIIQFHNAGEDPHDLWIQRVGDPEQLSIGELPPGELGELSLRLRRDSRYEMWCSLGDHRALGMDASVRVRRKRR
jgi:plastocyanin